MNIIQKILSEARAEMQLQRDAIESRRIIKQMPDSFFLELIQIECSAAMAKHNRLNDYEITEQNKPILKQLWLWLCNNAEFEGDLNKGIMIAGTNGIGKTIMMQGYCNLIRRCAQKTIRQIHAKRLAWELKKNGYDDFLQLPLFIDDLGKEQREMVEFGTRIQPIVDLMAMRYDTGAITFVTTNYKLDTMKEFYGNTIIDRFSEMFNIIEMGGKSYR